MNWMMWTFWFEVTPYGSLLQKSPHEGIIVSSGAAASDFATNVSKRTSQMSDIEDNNRYYSFFYAFVCSYWLQESLGSKQGSSTST